MKEKLFRPFVTSFLVLGAFTLLFGIVYPLVILALGYVVFPAHAKGSLLVDKNKKIIGSRLIGQNFQSSKYFHPRPSSAGPKGYDATSSDGSYLGPSSESLSETVSDLVSRYRSVNQLSNTVPVPADAAFSSGSGLDPHISAANALLQAGRVAKARNLSLTSIQNLIHKHSQTPLFSSSAMSYVNVLLLNLALDEIGTSK